MTDSTKVLIIEGDPELRAKLAEDLTEAGFMVNDVPDYPEALEELEKFKTDIAIVDEVLLCGDGKNACYKLHNSFRIPVILLGKDSSGEAWMRAMEAGADFYFTKPSHHQEVVAKVKAILRCYKELS